MTNTPDLVSQGKTWREKKVITMGGERGYCMIIKYLENTSIFISTI